jgi:small multidrug resistance pump
LLFFSLSLKRLDLGTAYAIWAGLGTVLIALIGVLYFRDGMDMIKAVSLAAIIAGVIGLNLSGAHGSAKKRGWRKPASPP